MAKPSTDTKIQRSVFLQFVKSGRPPTIDQLATACNLDRGSITAALRRLATDHRVMLYPGRSGEIWIAHPFCAVSTGYWIAHETRGWWGNCAFCALGIAALLHANVSIHFRIGGKSDPVSIQVAGGVIVNKGLKLHIPFPIAQWHDNILYTCGNVHFFYRDEDIAEWCDQHQCPYGESLRIEDAWGLAKSWYGDYLSGEWQPRSSAETNEMLRAHSLTGRFWTLPDA